VRRLNLFVMSTQQSGRSANFQHMLDEQSQHLGHIVDEVRAGGPRSVEASAEAEQTWVTTILKYAAPRRGSQIPQDAARDRQ